MSLSKPRVLVLGAGLAGLRGAQLLLEKGFHVEILERLDEPGGMSRSHIKSGYIFDHGPHGFFSRDEWIVAEFKELVGEDGYRWLTKWSQIHYRDEYFNYPLRLSDLASKMSPWTLLQAFCSFLWSRTRLTITGKQPMNAEEYLVDQFGRVLYNIFFGPYTNRVWAVPPRELDADFTRDRVPSLHLWDVIRKLFDGSVPERLTSSGRIPTHDLHTFYYPKQGARALSVGYIEKVRSLGGHLRTGVEIEHVDLKALVVRGRQGELPLALPFDYILNTIPLNTLVNLLYPSPPAEIASLAWGLRYRAVLLVCLCIRKPKVIDPFWIYYTDRFFNRISEYKHFSPELVPEGKTGICLEVGCQKGDDLWNASDAEVVAGAMPDLKDLGLVSEEEIEEFVVIREANAYPIYDVGYKRRLERLIDWIENTGLIMTAGRQGRFLYINQDAAIKSGFEAAQAIVGLHAGEDASLRLASAGDGPRRMVLG
jgi:protoporphyrinogen oxidase